MDVCSAVPDGWLAQDADLRTDLPLYRVYREGKLVEEVGYAVISVHLRVVTETTWRPCMIFRCVCGCHLGEGHHNVMERRHGGLPSRMLLLI